MSECLCSRTDSISLRDSGLDSLVWDGICLSRSSLISQVLLHERFVNVSLHVVSVS